LSHTSETLYYGDKLNEPTIIKKPEGVESLGWFNENNEV
jgi:hypothetical protein